MSNRTTFTIPASTQGSIYCLSNSTEYEQVTLIPPQGEMVTFVGTGLGKPMTTLQGDKKVIPIEPTQGEVQVTIAAQYSSSGPNGPFNESNVSPATTQNVAPNISNVSIVCTDNTASSSGCTLTFVLVGPPNGGASEGESVTRQHLASLDTSLTASNQLELHCKTYYDNPSLFGHGDEHYIIITQTPPNVLTLTYRGLSWQARIQYFWLSWAMFGGYLNIALSLGNCPYQGMQNAILCLSGSLGFWGSNIPFGTKSVDWTATLYQTDYKVTEVTN